MLVHFADAPTIRLIGSPEIDLEEDKDALVLRCVADANPPASIVWRRAGRSEIASLQVSQTTLPPYLYLSFPSLLLPIERHPGRQTPCQLVVYVATEFRRLSPYLS